MEDALLLTGGLACWAGAFALASGRRRGGAGERSAPGSRRGWGRGVEGALRRVGRTPPVLALSGIPSYRMVAEQVSGIASTWGVRLDPTSSAGALAIVALGGIVVCRLLSASPVGALVPVLAYVVGMPAYASAAARRRTRRVAGEMPAVFRTLSVALGSGETLAQAIGYVGTHGRGQVAEEFARASLGLRCGASAEDVLSELSGRLEAPGMELLVSALLISQRTGSPLRGLLLSSAKLVERQNEFERALSVKTAQARLSVRIVCLMPVVMIGLLCLMSPDFQRGLVTSQGMACVGIALGLDGIALLVIRRIMGSAL